MGDSHVEHAITIAQNTFLWAIVVMAFWAIVDVHKLSPAIVGTTIAYSTGLWAIGRLTM